MNIRNAHPTPFANARWLAALLALPLGIALISPAQAQTGAPPIATTSAGIPCDPCVPPAVREQAILEKARTAGIAAKAMPEAAADRLRARFDAADQRKVGRLTRAEAIAGGFGFIEQHFAQIDRSGRGEVTFEDLKAFLQARGAKLE